MQVRWAADFLATDETQIEPGYPQKEQHDVVVFELPVETIKWLHLERPAENFGGSGMLRFEISMSEIAAARAEAFGYEWLAKEGYTDIQFVARRDKQSERTPEFFGKSSTSKAILEVKTINRSEQEIDRLEMFPQPVLDLTQGLSDGFKNKFLDDIKNAREQLEKYDVPTDRKIVLVIIRPDFEFWCNDKIYKEIDEMASKLCAPGFEVRVHQLVR